MDNKYEQITEELIDFLSAILAIFDQHSPRDGPEV